MSDKVVAALITSGVAISLFVVKYWLDKRTAKKSAFKKAIADFKVAFTDEVIQLEKPHTSNPDNSPRVFIEKVATKHKNAAMELTRYLSKSQKIAFDALWSEYEGESKYDGVHDVAIVKRQLALDRIKKLIDFADNLKP